MSAETTEAVRREVLELLERLNRSWIEGRPQEIDELLHEEMVIVLPGFRGRVEGRAACAKSYADFSSRATIQDYKTSEHVVDAWGDTAVASYRFEIEYELEDEAHREFGRDLFVLTREQDTWRPVWRTIVPVTG